MLSFADLLTACTLIVYFFLPGADVLNDLPLYSFNLTTSKSAGYAFCQCAGVPPGTYDITAVSEHTLMNVKRSELIFEPSTTVNVGTLLEGDCNDDGHIDIVDFGILKQDFFGPSSQADFNRDGTVDISDFGLLKNNFFQNSPIEIP